MPDTCSICHAAINARTCYVTPDDGHAPRGYRRSATILNQYTCRRDECKAKAREQAGIKENER